LVGQCAERKWASELWTNSGKNCVIVQNFIKIDQTVLEILRFFDFQDGRRPPSWILKFLNIWSPVRWGWLICIAVTNLITIGQTVAEISHLTFFNMFDFLNS